MQFFNNFFNNEPKHSITFITFGIFALVVNAVVFYLAAWLLPGFSISGFWGAFWGAIVVSIINGIFVALAKNAKL